MRTTNYFSDDNDTNKEDSGYSCRNCANYKAPKVSPRRGLENDVFNRDWKFGDDEEYAPKFYYTLGYKMKEKRIEIGMSQADMADKIGISPSYLSHIEAGNRTPDLLILAKICSMLNMSLDELVFGAVNKEKAPFNAILSIAASKGKEAFDRFLSTSRVLAENADKL